MCNVPYYLINSIYHMFCTYWDIIQIFTHLKRRLNNQVSKTTLDNIINKYACITWD